MARTLYRNARVFTADPAQPDAEALVVDGDRLAYVGTEGRAVAAAGADAEVIDLGGAFVLPGVIDAHTHLVGMGRALGQVELTDARTIDEIVARLVAARDADPDAPRLFGRGWLFDSVPGGAPTAAMLDDAFPDVPVYLDANDYHSLWLNSAALRECGLTRDTPDPAGGRFSRDEAGEPDGVLYENAMEVADRVLQAARTDADVDAAIERMFDAYLAAGVTGAVDMGLSEEDVAGLRRAAARAPLPVRVAGHWLLANTGDPAADLAQVERAAALRDEIAREHPGARLEIVGVKVILDGVIDACTAAMRHPYANGSNADPLWSYDELAPVVARADALGLTVAIHAIGDYASELALDALEAAADANGPREGRRHRVEHLESVGADSVERLARLGVTASMQPVHADPAIQANWRAMLGDEERIARGFPWPEFTAAGALLAFGTDAPTAPHSAMQNLSIATTRESALDPSFPPNHPELAIPVAEAIAHATRDAAIACGWGEQSGCLAAGRAADFAVVDVDPFTAGGGALRTARVVRTVVDGRTVFEHPAAASARIGS